MSPTRPALKAAIAAAGAVGLLSTGVAFAASDHAPWSNATAGAASTHAADPTLPTHPTHATGAPSDDSSESTGPNVRALGGLCRAYASGNKTEKGKALESPAFVALVTAAGGANNVATFCSTVTTGPSGTHPTHPGHPTQAASPSHPAQPTRPAHPTHPTEGSTPSHPAPVQPSQRVNPTPPSH
ncbi:MAG TPA: hypothetical protein VGK78_13795 [Nocardioides sp.]|uniref:hypothetical protein n=1 Tax=Nocardioides sp. TaxID=35761 RepID=UPI002F40BD6D